MGNVSLISRLEEDIKTSMKAGDKLSVSTLRMAKAEIKLVEISQKKQPSDQETIFLIQRMIKQRKESITQYNNAGRNELAEKELQEIDILKKYLPEQLNLEEIELLVTLAINELHEPSIKDMGKLMSILKEKLEGKADMGKVSSLVKKALK